MSQEAARIWIFNPFDDIPGEGRPLRFWTLAEELGRQGHEVIWWSSTFSHRRKTFRELPDDIAEYSFTLRLVECPPYQKNISLARMQNHASWGRQLVADALALIESGASKAPDFILASMPPMEGPVAALELSQKYGSRVVTDIMDTWPETLLQAAPLGAFGRFLGSLMLRGYWRMLRKSVSQSHGLSAQSKRFAAYAKCYGGRQDAYVCYLGAEPVREIVEEGEAPSQVLKLVYIGAMGRSYDLETVIEAVRQIVDSRGPVLELHIAGEGEKLPDLIEQAADMAQIHFHGYLQQDDFEALMRNCDLGIIPMYPESGVAVPYKFGDYLAYGLPVINSLPGELADMIARANCGVAYTAGCLDSLVSALSSYVNMDSLSLNAQRASAVELFNRDFNRSKTYPDFAAWLAENNYN